jgi:hypothetical protein
MSNVRITVNSRHDGRVTNWVVRCSACDAGALTTKWRDIAVVFATGHSREGHGGKAVVAVRNQ